MGGFSLAPLPLSLQRVSFEMTCSAVILKFRKSVYNCVDVISNEGPVVHLVTALNSKPCYRLRLRNLLSVVGHFVIASFHLSRAPPNNSSFIIHHFFIPLRR
jgi:hypothetical protein